MYFETQLRRIRSICWANLGQKTDIQHAILVKKFLLNFLNHQELIGSKSPHFEPRELISDDKVSLPEEIRSEIISLPINFYVIQILLRHLQICRLADNKIEVAEKLVNLYNPLIEVIEDGGNLDLDKQKNIVVDGKGTHPVHDLSYLISG